MGLGGYLAARTVAEHYRAEYRRELRETEETPDEERREVRLILTEQGLDGALADTVVEALSRDRHRWVDFMMFPVLNWGWKSRMRRRAPTSALTIGVSYIVGRSDPAAALYADRAMRRRCAEGVSIVLTLVALALFGGVKGWLTGARPLRSSVQTVVIGGIAGAVAFPDRPRGIGFTDGALGPGALRKADRVEDRSGPGPCSTGACAMLATSCWKAGSFGPAASVWPETLATGLPPWNSASLTVTLVGEGS